ncbi:MAG: hypothetical protein M1813_001834 [Trichoglossum hirsutum]|nr:MAG: hypothetical protein M1813_001834 [Trichoglossum hirsutum]
MTKFVDKYDPGFEAVAGELIRVNNLGLVLGSLGRHEEAKAMHRRALERREKVLGLEHLDMLTSVSNLVSSLKKLGEHKGAVAMYRRAMEGRDKVLGLRHPDTLTSVRNLRSLSKTLSRRQEVKAIDKVWNLKS